VGVRRANLRSIDRLEDLRVDKKNNIKMDLNRNMTGRSGLEPSGLESEQVAETCDCGNEPSGSVRYRELLDWNSLLLKKGCLLHVVSQREFHLLLLFPAYTAVPNYRVSPSYLFYVAVLKNDTLYFFCISGNCGCIFIRCKSAEKNMSSTAIIKRVGRFAWAVQCSEHLQQKQPNVCSYESNQQDATI